jgi:rubrerythrin
MTIRGKITVPALVGSLKYLIEVCDSAGASIAGVPLELRLNEVMTKFGKVYSPYFIFPGTAEELIEAGKTAVGAKFRVLADEADEADDTEDSVEPADVPAPETSTAPTQETKKESAPAKENQGPSVADKKEDNVSTDKPAENMAPVADASTDVPATTEKTEPAKPTKKVKAFWCDACFRIVNDYATPAVCKCGQTKFHDAVDMKAAQEAIAKLRAENVEKKTAARAEKKSFFWCVECGLIVEGAKKPASCAMCNASHFSMATSREAAENSFRDRNKDQAPGENKPQDRPNTEKNTALNVIASRIKTVFGSSAPAAICKQISLLLDRQVESSESLTAEEIKDLLEATEVLEGLQKKSDRDQFITDWKAARGA